jgi:signal transduction histidine kinase
VRYGGGVEGSRWWLAVLDQGPGLPPHVAARLGEPYLTTKEGGSGLGLAVVVQIAEAHGGSVSSRSRDGGGLEMRLEFAGATRDEATGPAREDRP